MDFVSLFFMKNSSFVQSFSRPGILHLSSSFRLRLMSLKYTKKKQNQNAVDSWRVYLISDFDNKSESLGLTKLRTIVY